MINELDGFVVFTASGRAYDGPIQLSVTDKYARPSRTALRAIGDPKHVVAFFDERKKRLMLMAGKKDTPNALKVLWSPDGSQNGVSSVGLCSEILRLAGIPSEPNMHSVKFPGHVVEGADGKVIFELGGRSEGK